MPGSGAPVAEPGTGVVPLVWLKAREQNTSEKVAARDRERRLM
jgi:hypothetical protein